MCHAQGGNKFCRVILISVYFNYRRHTQFIVALFWPLHVHMAPRHPGTLFNGPHIESTTAAPTTTTTTSYYCYYYYHHHHDRRPRCCPGLLQYPMASIQYPSASSLSVHSSLWLTPWLRNRFRSTTTVHSSRYYLIAFHISTPTRHRINCDIIGNPIRMLPPLVPSRPQHCSSSPSAQHQ